MKKKILHIDVNLANMTYKNYDTEPLFYKKYNHMRYKIDKQSKTNNKNTTNNTNTANTANTANNTNTENNIDKIIIYSIGIWFVSMVIIIIILL